MARLSTSDSIGQGGSSIGLALGMVDVGLDVWGMHGYEHVVSARQRRLLLSR